MHATIVAAAQQCICVWSAGDPVLHACWLDVQRKRLYNAIATAAVTAVRAAVLAEVFVFSMQFCTQLHTPHGNLTYRAYRA
jgi:hypothetical protein